MSRYYVESHRLSPNVKSSPLNVPISFTNLVEIPSCAIQLNWITMSKKVLMGLVTIIKLNFYYSIELIIYLKIKMIEQICCKPNFCQKAPHKSVTRTLLSAQLRWNFYLSQSTRFWSALYPYAGTTLT